MASRTHNVAIPSNLDELLQAASCWLLESVPPALAAMVVGALRINALPPAVIARRAAQRPLRRNEQSADLPASAEGTYARVVDALVAVPTGASTASREFLVDAQRVLARHAKEARGVALTKIFSELVGFASQVGQVSQSALLIFGWTLYALQYGTARKRTASHRSVSRYLTELIDSLFRECGRAQINLLSASSEERSALYVKACEVARRASIAHAAIASFEAYLREDHGLDPARLPRAAMDRFCVPRASLLWPHEVSPVRELLAADYTDPRLKQQCDLIFLLLHHLNLRIGEIGQLRMHSVRIFDGHVQLHIAPTGRDQGTKSRHSRGVVTITCPATRQGLLDWVDLRAEVDLASDEDHLFAMPQRPRAAANIGACIVKIQAACDARQVMNLWLFMRFVTVSLRRLLGRFLLALRTTI